MSNIYPIWWDTNITIYNKFEDPQTRLVTWYRRSLSNCFWKYVGNKVVVADVTLQTNNVICRIPKDEAFLEKYLWIELANDQKANYFTISPGDIIVKGTISEDIDEYTSGKRSTDFIKKYKSLAGCMEVDQLAIDTGAGRCSEHYYVVGA